MGIRPPFFFREARRLALQRCEQWMTELDRREASRLTKLVSQRGENLSRSYPLCDEQTLEK